jgi:hypothetical protein
MNYSSNPYLAIRRTENGYLVYYNEKEYSFESKTALLRWLQDVIIED